MVPNLPLNDLADRLWAQDSRKEDVRTNPDFVHVSALLNDWCAREYALALRYLEHGPRQKQPSGSDRLVWKIGRAVEEHIRESLIESYGAENIYAKWYCPCEESHCVSFGRINVLSECCGKPFNRFKEYVIQSEKHDLTGSIDLLLHQFGYMIPVEIKSITDSPNANKTGKGFSSLTTRPLGSHANQVTIYHQLIGEEPSMPFPIADFCIVIYGRKEYQFTTPYKEFRVDMSATSPWPKLARNIMAKAPSVFGDTLPAKICPNDSCTRAKNCEHVQACFRL